MDRTGFTLIEILVVIVVLAVLAGLVAPAVFQHVGTAKDAAARSQSKRQSGLFRRFLAERLAGTG